MSSNNCIAFALAAALILQSCSEPPHEDPAQGNPARPAPVSAATRDGADQEPVARAQAPRKDTKTVVATSTSIGQTTSYVGSGDAADCRKCAERFRDDFKAQASEARSCEFTLDFSKATVSDSIPDGDGGGVFHKRTDFCFIDLPVTNSCFAEGQGDLSYGSSDACACACADKETELRALGTMTKTVQVSKEKSAGGDGSGYSDGDKQM